MLMYDLGPRALNDRNRELLKIGKDVIEAIQREIDAVLVRGIAATDGSDETASRDEFMILVGLALRHGIEAGAIADRLGITVSTVHRWARGTFVPPQPFVREAALRGMRELLRRELDRLAPIGSPPTGVQDGDDVPDDLVPRIDVDVRRSGRGSADTVVPLQSAATGKGKRGYATTSRPRAVDKVG